MKDIRVIIDADTACEGDDPFAIVHALLSPELDIRAVCSEHYISYPLLGAVPPFSEEKSFRENKRFVRLAGREDVPVLHGAKTALRDENHFIENEASRFIVAEANREDERRLFVVTQGAVTNIASAWLMDSSIEKKLTVIMISGAPYPDGGPEYNCIGDLHAANVLLNSDLEIWQVPSNVYGTMCVSFQELLEKVWHRGNLGKALVENLQRVNRGMCGSFLRNSTLAVKMNMQFMYPFGSTWRLGDSPVVGLLLNENMGSFTMEEAPNFAVIPGRKLQSGGYVPRCGKSHPIRVYHSIDSRRILNDLYQKLAAFAPADPGERPPRHICPLSKKVNLILESEHTRDILCAVRWARVESKIGEILVISDVDLPGDIPHVTRDKAKAAVAELTGRSRIPSAYLTDSGIYGLGEGKKQNIAVYFCGEGILTDGRKLALMSDMRCFVLPEEAVPEYRGQKNRLLALGALLLDNHEFASQNIQSYDGVPCGRNTVLVSRIVEGLVPEKYNLEPVAE